ncbi:hypothetical protein B0T10DRAFT_452804 [Thelonectria olida]|uniref:Uncharacterized protein n=1 Tax=Thelonectria olida TaxID=1576542 RepID=A0A9P9AX00_9HYPO|nr:hypothetical protein B0T10DRAFT_452804 [Thelonectria olida]
MDPDMSARPQRKKLYEQRGAAVSLQVIVFSRPALQSDNASTLDPGEPNMGASIDAIGAQQPTSATCAPNHHGISRKCILYSWRHEVCLGRLHAEPNDLAFSVRPVHISTSNPSSCSDGSNLVSRAVDSKRDLRPWNPPWRNSQRCNFIGLYPFGLDLAEWSATRPVREAVPVKAAKPPAQHQRTEYEASLEATSEAIARIRRWKGKWELVTAGYRQRGGVVPRFRALLLSSLLGLGLRGFDVEPPFHEDPQRSDGPFRKFPEHAGRPTSMFMNVAIPSRCPVSSIRRDGETWRDSRKVMGQRWLKGMRDEMAMGRGSIPVPRMSLWFCRRLSNLSRYSPVSSQATASHVLGKAVWPGMSSPVADSAA